MKELAVFTVRAEFYTSEYGSLFVVASPDAKGAEELVTKSLERDEYRSIRVGMAQIIGSTIMYKEPKILDSFIT